MNKLMEAVDHLHTYVVLMDKHLRDIKRHGENSPQGKKALTEIAFLRRVVARAMLTIEQSGGAYD